MKTNLTTRHTVLNLTCALVMLVLLVLQFMPFWTYGEPAQSVSIQEYIWFPGNHTGLDKVMQATLYSDYKIDDILLMPILTLVLGAAGIVLCIFKADNPFVSLLPTACGAVSALGYLTHSAFQTGSNWTLHLLVCIILFVLGLVSLITTFKSKKA